MPWTLIDFAESQGIHVRTYNNSEEAAAAPAETSKPFRPQRYLNRGSYSEVQPSNYMFSAITGAVRTTTTRTWRRTTVGSAGRSSRVAGLLLRSGRARAGPGA